MRRVGNRCRIEYRFILANFRRCVVFVPTEFKIFFPKIRIRVASSRFGFANAWWPITKTDVTAFLACVTEFLKASVFLGYDEGSIRHIYHRLVSVVIHSHMSSTHVLWWLWAALGDLGDSILQCATGHSSRPLAVGSSEVCLARFFFAFEPTRFLLATLFATPAHYKTLGTRSGSRDKPLPRQDPEGRSE